MSKPKRLYTKRQLLSMTKDQLVQQYLIVEDALREERAAYDKHMDELRRQHMEAWHDLEGRLMRTQQERDDNKEAINKLTNEYFGHIKDEKARGDNYKASLEAVRNQKSGYEEAVRDIVRVALQERS